MAEFVEKLILDDTEFISGLENAGKKASELGGKLDKMNKDIKTGTDQKTKSVVDGQKQMDAAIKKTIETQNKEVEALKKTNEALALNKKQTSEVAAAISKVPQQAQAFVKLIDKLKDFKIEYVILGHSERRELGETNQDINKKLRNLHF